MQPGSESGGEPSQQVAVTRKRGVPVTLVANYFELAKLPRFELCQYRVDFEPEIDVTTTRKELVNKNRDKIGSKFVFDGASMYLTTHFDEQCIETTHLGQQMLIKIRKTGMIDSHDPAAFQLLNLMFRDAMAGLKLQTVRRDLFDPQAKIDVPEGNLELWPGYITSIRNHEDKTLLCAEISHKVMRKESILDIATGLMRNSGRNWHELLEKQIVGSTVLTDYTNKTYQIDSIDYTMTPRSRFTPANSEETTYEDYYKTRYGITIKDNRQFMLVSNAKERDLRAGRQEFIYLIPELSRATGMTDEMRQNFSLMRDLSNHTRLKPEDRVKKLLKFNQRIQQTPASLNVLNDWNMELSRDLLKVPGRELPREMIIFGDGEQVTASDRGEWNLKNGVGMFEPASIIRWIVIFPNQLQKDTENFIKVLRSAADSMKLEMAAPIMKGIEGDRADTYIDLIRLLAPNTPKILLIVLPTNRADRYSSVKKACLVELGIPAQVVVKRTINHKNINSVASKIAIQMSAKLNGMPWTIKMPVKGLMCVGFDVSINPSDRSKSIGAIVATMDINVSGAFFSTTSSYRDGNEMNQKLGDHMKRALQIYEENCGQLPEKIVFYRDGVGEGQIPFVKQQEIDPLLKKLENIYGEKSPKLAYIIVNKRINSRVFKKSGNMHMNPQPGTVVDQGITFENREDFYLVSQHVGQGTVSPTYYNILYNNTGLDLEKIEILTFKYTHLYYNWGGTTRIPSVCQYAKKLAFMTSQSLQAPCHPQLESSLYFL